MLLFLQIITYGFFQDTIYPYTQKSFKLVQQSNNTLTLDFLTSHFMRTTTSMREVQAAVRNGMEIEYISSLTRRQG